jgi:hypothetical protein
LESKYSNLFFVLFLFCFCFVFFFFCFFLFFFVKKGQHAEYLGEARVYWAFPAERTISVLKRLVHDRGHPVVNLMHNLRLARVLDSLDEELVRSARNKILARGGAHLLDTFDTLLAAQEPSARCYLEPNPILPFDAIVPAMQLWFEQPLSEEELLFACQSACKFSS